MRLFLLISLSFLLNACSFWGQPDKTGPGWYLVKPSDTLYSIAWRYDINVKDLASWNGITSPFTIYPGQYLRLIKSSSDPTPVATKKSSTPTKQPKKISKSAPVKNINWQWPVKGKVLNKFSFTDVNKRGIDIASKVGQPIQAVASGKVVYSGNGLAGYKNLIIIKHNNFFLSAYAQNKNLLVKEGDTIKQGQKIADMGNQNNSSYLLHFQIRKNGKPVDPIRYLPKLK